MAEAKNEFTNVSSLRSESIGEPGNRTFRVVVNSESSSASIWLEKEQLFQLALAIQQIVANLPEDRETDTDAPTDQEADPLTSLDFKATKLVLGHDGARNLFILDAHDPDDDDVAIIRMWANEEQVHAFSEEAMLVCAAGRPHCPLCGWPMDPSGHRCARTNGAADLSQLDPNDP
ncbi:MAG: DUF3090 family protein [SAR202 cluster bacterium]|jgi:uncharacterized repeat protein (TIGR03847 family)|nr:DUF3090 family protein [SAR202 cluster bacterium]MDP6300632.1 DUF3090 family protein [SAR202 cluster bacterium]MDP7102354.1 DUF3090 family protein [SAR202 cluster bacterium]MDP7225451.1 DUF3090 family protein [SAR202 cluster bacterium]MDP7414124.1 DUF3090 family protein [SAR202 cluster bacterium]|tara:strand:+ start:2412 stop:2936 length:525 start_codon:yes stop_codon:yes gene_type:complete